MIVRDRRENERGLSLEPGLEEPFIHPHLIPIVSRIGVLSPLPMRAPSAIRSLYYIDDPFFLTGVIAVIVHADEVAELVEIEFVCVA